MGRVFLSYDRQDEARARPVAALLERAGHSVWWDRQIKGGHEFGAEIEAALDAADKVIVLWSFQSIRSAWVRDEAAAGRDRGRLVPVTIDGTAAPLGFRQFQTIDLSKWKGRGSPPEVQQLLDAIESSDFRPETARRSDFKWPHLRLTRPLAVSFLVLVAIITLGAVALLWDPFVAPKEVRIAIAPEDGSALSRQVANDLALGLGNLTDENSSAYQVVDAADGRAVQADLTLNAGGISQNGRDRRDLSLRSANGEILWSTTIDQQPSASAGLSQQLAAQAQRILSCAGEALTYRRERIRGETLKLYVSGCANYDSAYGLNSDVSALIKQFQQVIAKAPHFEPAWIKLMMSEVSNLDQVEDPVALRRTIAGQINDARKLGLDFAEIYIAQAATYSPDDFVDIFRAYDEGVKRHPDNANLYVARSYRNTYVGRMMEAVADGSHAAQLDPLSPAKQENLALVNAYSGNSDTAYAVLRRAEQLWPKAPTLIYARYGLDLRYGDPKEALAILQDPSIRGPMQVQQAAFINARINPTPENIERSIAEERKIHAQFPQFISQIVQTLAQFGRKDDVIALLVNYSGGSDLAGLNAEVLFRPALRDVWRDPRSMAAAAHLGLLHYWKVSGRWPDFCSDATLPYNCKNEGAKYPA